MLTAMNAGKGKLGDSAEMAALVKGADKTAPAWAVAKISESYRQAEVLAPFDTVSASVAIKDGKIMAKFEGKGKDKEKMDGAVEMVNTSVKTELEQMKQMEKNEDVPAGVPPEVAARIKESRQQELESLRPVMEVGETVKAVSVVNGAVLTAEMKVETLRQMIGSAVGGMLSVQRRNGAATAPAGVEEEELTPARP